MDSQEPQVNKITGLGQWNHLAMIEQKTQDTWFIFCYFCSEEANDYIKCSYLDYIPNVLVAEE